LIEDERAALWPYESPGRAAHGSQRMRSNVSEVGNGGHLGGIAFHSRSLPPTQQGFAALHKTSARGAPHKESQPTSEITPPHTSAFHSSTRPRPAHPSGASRAHPHLSSLHIFTRAQRTRVHFFLPAALTSAQFGFVLVRGRVRLIWADTASSTNIARLPH
jgi:hypothetical protein